MPAKAPRRRASTSFCMRGKTWMAGTSPAMTECLRHARRRRASTSFWIRGKTWMAGTSPAMTECLRHAREGAAKAGTHVFLHAGQDVDGRDKPGHDGVDCATSFLTTRDLHGSFESFCCGRRL